MTASDIPESEGALRRAITSHPRLFEANRYVYPVLSRRSGGLSIGVNLNPDKACNFNCIYCQVDRRTPPRDREVDLDVVAGELRALPKDARSGALFNHATFRDVPDALKRVNDIAFSGDGEPTAYPRFREAVDRVVAVKRELGLGEVKLVVLTNCSRLHRPDVRRALETMHRHNGEIWAKLDAGRASYYGLVNRSRVPFDRIVENLRNAARQWPLVVQTLWMRIRGTPPPPEEVSAYCDLLADVLEGGGKLKLIQLHTVARPPAESYVAPLPGEALDRIADTVRSRLSGVPVAVYYGTHPEA